MVLLIFSKGIDFFSQGVVKIFFRQNRRYLYGKHIWVGMAKRDWLPVPSPIGLSLLAVNLFIFFAE